MKHNLYELFSDYDRELPEIDEQPCNTDRIRQLVLEGTQKKIQKKHIKPKMFIICAAAVMTAVTGMTVAAATTDGFSRFRDILHRTEPSANMTGELPLLNGEDVSGMERNISENRIVFTGEGDMTVSTAGMYYDRNTLMLSLEMKVREGINVPENAVVIADYSKLGNGTSTVLTGQSGLANTAALTRSDDPYTYYATFYLTSQDIANSRIGVSINRIISADDISDIQSRIIAEQTEWREEFGFGTHTVDEWKLYWKENDFDLRTRKLLDEYILKCDSIIEGEWTAELNISDADEASAFSRDGFTVTADTLSLTLDNDRELSETEIAVPVVTAKDGSVMYDGGTREKEWFAENGIINGQNSFCFANRFSNVFSYCKPVPVSCIENISVYVFELSDGSLTAERHIIYEAEEEK